MRASVHMMVPGATHRLSAKVLEDNTVYAMEMITDAMLFNGEQTLTSNVFLSNLKGNLLFIHALVF